MEEINLYLEKYFDGECYVCHKDYNECRHYFDNAEAYLEKILEIVDENK